ncbi:MAG: NUDIX hydrolase [Candidatus Shapirobacteria bacterium]
MQYTKVAAHALIKKDNKYLVTKRPANDDYMPNFWDTPGGTIDFGEKILDALVREIKEETDLTVKVGNIIFCHNHLSGTERHQFELVYQCEYIGGDIKLDPEEHSEFKWVTLEEMESLQKITFLEELLKSLK